MRPRGICRSNLRRLLLRLSVPAFCVLRNVRSVLLLIGSALKLSKPLLMLPGSVRSVVGLPGVGTFSLRMRAGWILER